MPATPSPISDAIRRLNEWEEELKIWFPNITLLGEISLSGVEVEEIGTALRAAGQTRVQKPTWPHTLLVFMAAVAARNEKMEYWAVLADSLGVKQTQQFQSHFGQMFELWSQIFHAMYTTPAIFLKVGGYRYVTPIRLHGGIPAYSLPDFFEDVVLPAVRKPDYAGMDAKELIPLVLQRSEVMYFVDSPVRYFLEHGGEAAEGFFDRCLEMARRWETEGGGLSAQELGLPRYVVDAFESFMEGQRRTAQGRRLRPPQFLLAPTYGDSLYSVELPAQPVDVEQAGWRYWWRLRPFTPDGAPLAGEEMEEPVRVRRTGHDLLTESREVPLFLPPCRLQIELEAAPPGEETEILGRWRFALAPGDGDLLLAFRPADGRPLRGQSLPADVLWLLYPQEAEVGIGGQAHCIQRFPELLGAWAGWQVAEWDLRQARSLWLVDGDGARLGHPLAVQQAQAEARLLGDNRMETLSDGTSSPLFVGGPPSLWLPRLTGDAAAQEMAQWKLTLTPRWSAHSRLSGESEISLESQAAAVEPRSDSLVLPLAPLLGEDALGSFDLTLRGPRTFRQEMRLRLWLGLSVEGLQPYYLPTLKGAQPADFTVFVDPDQRVAAPVGESGVQISGSGGRFLVTVAGEASQATLELQAPRPQGEGVRLLVRLPIPRLRWLLRLDDAAGEWLTTPGELSVDRLSQSSQRVLLLDWAGVDEIPACSLALLDESTNPPRLLQEEPLPAVRGMSHRLSVEVGRFHDSIGHHADVPILTLALRLYDGSGATLPLLRLKRSLDVKGLFLDWNHSGETWLHWDAPHRLRNRRVRIWSAWRPWEAAREFLIPDDALPSPAADGPGSGMLRLSVQLPVGWYQVALRTAHSWESLSAPPLPTEDALLSREGDWELRALEVEELIDADKEHAFEARWELSCIYDAVDRLKERNQQIEWLCRHLEQATPRQLTALRRWMEQTEPNSARALRMRMYGPQQIQKLFDEVEDQAEREAYLEEFTSARTVNPETAKAVLGQMQHPALVVHALQVLVDRELTAAIDYLLAEMERGGYGDRDALQLLEKRAADSFAELKRSPSSRARERLLLGLAGRLPDAGMVQPGHWVRSAAGWGRIERIEANDTDRAFFFQGEDVLLHVILRANQERELIVIDTGKRTIRFLKTQQVYQCTKDDCGGFASYSERLVRHEHNRAAHMGVGPSFVGKSAQFFYQQSLYFSQQAPENQYA